jgi:hypothetical protein
LSIDGSTARGEEVRQDVQPPHRIPQSIVLKLAKLARPGDAGIRVPHIDRSQPFFGQRRDPPHVRLDGDISAQPDRSDLGRDPGGGLLIDVCHEYLRALGREPLGDRLAYSVTGSRYDGDLAGKLHRFLPDRRGGYGFQARRTPQNSYINI